MKKLQLKMRELNNPEVLTRQQLQNVLGGSGGVTTAAGTCIITTVRPNNGGTVTQTLSYSSQWSCSAQSTDASQKADQQQNQYGGTTHYDCGCDGWGV